MPNLGAGEWLIILLVIVILFGSAKLPSLARSLGKSMRILKAETKGLHEEDETPAQQPQSQKQAPGQLPSAGQDDATTINGVPLSEAERARRNS